MARETFEDQAAAVRRVLKGEAVSKADKKHLECAARNLQAFGEFRSKVLKAAENSMSDIEIEGIADEILQLFHLPVTQ